MKITGLKEIKTTQSSIKKNDYCNKLLNDISKIKFVFLNESLSPYMITYIKRNLKYEIFQESKPKGQKNKLQ